MNLLDDPSVLEKLDPSGMLELSARLPHNCREGWEQGLAWTVPPRLSRCQQVLVLGMGGSAIGADLLVGLLGNKLKRPISVNRTYRIPAWVDSNTLVLACSYSGNTEETLSGVKEALRKKVSVAAISSGGALAQMSLKKGLPFLRIPGGLPPRSAIGYLAFAPMGLLVQLGWVRTGDLPVEKACQYVEKLIETQLGPHVRSSGNPAKKIAAQLMGRLPVLYGAAGGWEGITYRWRTQLEENAKTLAFHHIVPEATHNEISGWVQPRGLMRHSAAVFITDLGIHPRTLKRMEFTAGLIRRQGAAVLKASVTGSTSVFSRMLGLVSLGDFISIYLACAYKINPTPVERVEALKKFMKK